MINLFSKKSASQVNLDRIASEKLIENLDEQGEALLAGGSLAVPSYLSQDNKAKNAAIAVIFIW